MNLVTTPKNRNILQSKKIQKNRKIVITLKQVTKYTSTSYYITWDSDHIPPLHFIKHYLQLNSVRFTTIFSSNFLKSTFIILI